MVRKQIGKKFLLYQDDDGRRWIELRTVAALFQETPESLLEKYIVLYPNAKLPVYSRRRQAMWRASLQEILVLQEEIEVPLAWVYAILDAQ